MNTTKLLILAVILSVAGAFYFTSDRLGGASDAPIAKLTSTVARPNILVLLIDTTRADHLGSYGYVRDTSPVMDRLAKENIQYKYAVCSAPWTPPSVASILTGLYMSSHGMYPPDSRELAKQRKTRVIDAVTTLPEILDANGYRTAGISPNPWITAEFGFTQGFETFQFEARVNAEGINSLAFPLIDSMAADRSKPFFLYLHYMDPHTPYSPPTDYKQKFKGQPTQRRYDEKATRRINLYDAEINYMDFHLGKLFDKLKSVGLYDDLVIVLVGDHGEQFDEHGEYGHGKQLYNTEVHVPLILKVPGVGPKTVDETVATLDIFPTLLDLAGVKHPVADYAVSLLDEGAQRKRPGVLSEIRRRYTQAAFTARNGDKLLVGSDRSRAKDINVEDPDKFTVSVMNARKDYWEKSKIDSSDLYSELKKNYLDLVGEVKSSRVDAPDSADQHKTPEVSEETLQQLKSLGYF